MTDKQGAASHEEVREYVDLVNDVRRAALTVPASPLLDVEQARRYLRVGRTTLYELIGRDLPLVKIANRTFLHKEDCDKFIAAGRQKTKPERDRGPARSVPRPSRRRAIAP
jgi:hypothetical protein